MAGMLRPAWKICPSRYGMGAGNKKKETEREGTGDIRSGSCSPFLMQPPSGAGRKPRKMQSGKGRDLMVTKKITKSGAVTLPRQVRQMTGLLPGVPVDMEEGPGWVYITKHVPTCHFCGAADEVYKILGIEICRSCAGKIKEVVEDDAGRGKREG